MLVVDAHETSTQPILRARHQPSSSILVLNDNHKCNAAHFALFQPFSELKMRRNEAQSGLKAVLKPLFSPIHHFLFHRGASLQYYLRQLQEARHHGNAMEVQSVLRL